MMCKPCSAVLVLGVSFTKICPPLNWPHDDLLTREGMWTQIMVKAGGNPEGCIGDGSCSGGTQWEVTILDTQAMIDFTSAKGRLKELRSIAPMLESCRAQT